MEEDFIEEVTSLGEAVLKEAVEDGVGLVDEVLLMVLLTVFKGVETIEEGSSAEAELHDADGFAGVDAQAVA